MRKTTLEGIMLTIPNPTEATRLTPGFNAGRRVMADVAGLYPTPVQSERARAARLARQEQQDSESRRHALALYLAAAQVLATSPLPPAPAAAPAPAADDEPSTFLPLAAPEYGDKLTRRYVAALELLPEGWEPSAYAVERASILIARLPYSAGDPATELSGAAVATLGMAARVHCRELPVLADEADDSEWLRVIRTGIRVGVNDVQDSVRTITRNETPAGDLLPTVEAIHPAHPEPSTDAPTIGDVVAADAERRGLTDEQVDALYAAALDVDAGKRRQLPRGQAAQFRATARYMGYLVNRRGVTVRERAAERMVRHATRLVRLNAANIGSDVGDINASKVPPFGPAAPVRHPARVGQVTVRQS